MTDSIYPIDPDTILADITATKALGARYAESYQSGEPYHHICIDNFLPEPVIDHVIADLE